MKILMLIIVILFVGCLSPAGKLEEENDQLQEQIKYLKEGNGTKPIRKLTAEEESVAGSYDGKTLDGDTSKVFLLENRTIEHYVNGRKENKIWNWKIVGKEVHIEGKIAHYDLFSDPLEKVTSVYIIEPSGDLTVIALIHFADGKRLEVFKRIPINSEKT